MRKLSRMPRIVQGLYYFGCLMPIGLMGIVVLWGMKRLRGK
jgi:hypothetical protein